MLTNLAKELVGVVHVSAALVPHLLHFHLNPFLQTGYMDKLRGTLAVARTDQRVTFFIPHHADFAESFRLTTFFSLKLGFFD